MSMVVLQRHATITEPNGIVISIVSNQCRLLWK
jgi:hypothetical protein